jgi:aspartate aminotransferase
MTSLLSDRVINMAESATLAMAQAARDLASKGVKVINLSVGEPDFKTPTYICEAAKKAIDAGHHQYTPVPGIPELRKAIADKLKKENNIDANPADIVVSTGAKQSIANVILSIVNPGDEVVILAPYWVSYSDIVEFAGGIPVIVQSTIENNFKCTAADIKAAITPKTKCVMFSSPSNPAGSMFTEAELKAIVAVVPDPIVFLADEIYECINYTGSYTSIGSLEGAKNRTVTINGFSKGFAMTGWRVGYIHGPSAIVKATDKIQGQMTSGTNSITQHACVTALTDEDNKIASISEMKDAFLRRRDLILSLVKDIPGVTTNVPDGAFYIFPDVSSYFGKTTPDGTKITNAMDLSLYFLNFANVSCVTGEAFGAPNNLRFSYATSDEKIVEAMAKVKEWLAKLV